jgi:hypothetical protein
MKVCVFQPPNGADEDEPCHGLIEEGLAPLHPEFAAVPDVGALMLARPERLFL